MTEEEQDQVHLPHSTAPTDSLLSCQILLNPSQDQGSTDREHHLYQQQPEEPNQLLPIGGSSNHPLSFQYTREDQHAHGSVKWMSSKMRWMKKMMGSDQILISKPTRRTQALQDHEHPINYHDSSSSRNNNNSSSSIIRICSNCNTTKTPLWRSGPRGPKSLCNACGIRQMKARRAMAVAAALSSGIIPADAPKIKVQKKEKRSDVDRTIPIKKRYKIASSVPDQKKPRFDDSTISLSKNLAFYQAFPQEEKEAAILLMALSCGLIHG